MHGFLTFEVNLIESLETKLVSGPEPDAASLASWIESHSLEAAL
jgi:hypothetical protein